MELAAVTGGTLYNSSCGQERFVGVSIDSRQVTKGQLFIAVRGERLDGHDYIDQAVMLGASGVLSASDNPRLHQIRGDVAVVAVEDTHEAMLKLAVTYRNALTAKVIGITGSNGKTTTKELAARLFRAVVTDAYASPGNFNNLFGVPLALFAVPSSAKVAVLELGISTRHEMPRLAEIVRPHVIVITNVGRTHLEFLGSVPAVAKAKLALVAQAGPEVPVVVNADDPILMQETARVREKFFTFGLEKAADFKTESIEPDMLGGSLVTIEGHPFHLPLMGRHQVYNLLAAYAAVKLSGFSFDRIDTRSIQLDTAPMRGQTIQRGGVSFVTDCYNANPDSVKTGLEAFFELAKEGRRIVVLGDMLELGDDSKLYHREMGKELGKYSPHTAILVGPMTRFAMEEAQKLNSSTKFQHFDRAVAAAEFLRGYLLPQDLVYLKGSRGVGLEAVLQAFPEGNES